MKSYLELNYVETIWDLIAIKSYSFCVDQYFKLTKECIFCFMFGYDSFFRKFVLSHIFCFPLEMNAFLVDCYC